MREKLVKGGNKACAVRGGRVKHKANRTTPGAFTSRLDLDQTQPRWGCMYGGLVGNIGALSLTRLPTSAALGPLFANTGVTALQGLLEVNDTHRPEGGPMLLGGGLL
jgi:hypothetical protein